MKKPKGRKIKKDSPLNDSIQQYKKARGLLTKFSSNNVKLLDEYFDLIEEVNRAKSSLQTLAVESSGHSGLGQYTLYEDNDLEIKQKIKSGNRKVDAAALLAKYPKLRNWKGLFSVTVGQFDKVVSANQVTQKDAEAFTSAPVSDKVDVIDKE